MSVAAPINCAPDPLWCLARSAHDARPLHGTMTSSQGWWSS